MIWGEGSKVNWNEVTGASKKPIERSPFKRNKEKEQIMSRAGLGLEGGIKRYDFPLRTGEKRKGAQNKKKKKKEIHQNLRSPLPAKPRMPKVR